MQLSNVEKKGTKKSTFCIFLASCVNVSCDHCMTANFSKIY